MYDGHRVGGRGYVLHVAVPVTKLVPLDDAGMPTDVPLSSARTPTWPNAELSPGITTACDTQCCELNPECVVKHRDWTSDQYARRFVI